jgi:hypothetical protein
VTTSNPRRGAIKGSLSVVVVALLLLITLALQPSIGAPAATAIFLSGVAVVVVADWLL